MRPLLEARELHKAFGRSRALDGASIAIDPGEIVAIMGPSGSGKSTLLHCLAGIVAPDAGELRFNDRDLLTLSDAERSALRLRDFGFVFQFGQLVPELTCLENVALPLQLSGVARRAAERAAAEWLSDLGIPDVAGLRQGDVSGGQAQRVAVARALVHRPQVIFADEPTGALDSYNGERVMELLVTRAQERGAAVVLVTHDARVAAYASRSVTVRDGRAADLTVAA